MKLFNLDELNLDWDMAYLGVKNDWISPSKALEHIAQESIEALNSEQLGDLYISSDESKEDFLKKLKQLQLINEEKHNYIQEKWNMIMLKFIDNSNVSRQVKMENVANLWAMVNYPPEWENFIYYMPIQNGNSEGINYIYENFIRYIRNN